MAKTINFMVKLSSPMDLQKAAAGFSLTFAWITTFNPQIIPMILSCLASIYAIRAYRSTIKKNKQK